MAHAYFPESERGRCVYVTAVMVLLDQPLNRVAITKQIHMLAIEFGVRDNIITEEAANDFKVNQLCTWCGGAHLDFACDASDNGKMYRCGNCHLYGHVSNQCTFDTEDYFHDPELLGWSAGKGTHHMFAKGTVVAKQLTFWSRDENRRWEDLLKHDGNLAAVSEDLNRHLANRVHANNKREARNPRCRPSYVRDGKGTYGTLRILSLIHI